MHFYGGYFLKEGIFTESIFLKGHSAESTVPPAVSICTLADSQKMIYKKSKRWAKKGMGSASKMESRTLLLRLLFFGPLFIFLLSNLAFFDRTSGVALRSFFLALRRALVENGSRVGPR